MSNDGGWVGKVRGGGRHKRTNSSISRNKTFAVFLINVYLAKKKETEKANAKKVSTTRTMSCPFCLKARPTMFLANAFGLLFAALFHLFRLAFCRFCSFNNNFAT